MNRDLPGFEKSAPTSHPHTRSQSSASAWDIDLSPFHRLLESHAAATNQMIETFSAKIEELVSTIREENKQNQKKDQQFQEKYLQAQKSQIKQFDDVAGNVAEILEQTRQIQQNFQEAWERQIQILENLQKNAMDLSRSSVSQENLLREGFSFAEITTPIEKLVFMEEGALHQLQFLAEKSKEVSLTSEHFMSEVAKDWERRAEAIENLLIALGSTLKSHLGDQNKILSNIESSSAEMSQKIEELSLSLEGRQKREEKAKSWILKQDLIYMIFYVILLVLIVILILKTN